MGVCRFYIHLRPGLRGEIQHLLLYIGIIDMAVNIQGDAGRGVAHEVLHAFDIQPAADQAGAEGVAQDVRGEGGNGDTAALGVAPMDIAEDAVEIDAMQGAGAIEAGK